MPKRIFLSRGLRGHRMYSTQEPLNLNKFSEGLKILGFLVALGGSVYTLAGSYATLQAEVKTVDTGLAELKQDVAISRQDIASYSDKMDRLFGELRKYGQLESLELRLRQESDAKENRALREKDIDKIEKKVSRIEGGLGPKMNETPID